jgi:hypothetical protein
MHVHGAVWANSVIWSAPHHDNDILVLVVVQTVDKYEYAKPTATKHNRHCALVGMFAIWLPLLRL